MLESVKILTTLSNNTKNGRNFYVLNNTTRAIIFLLYNVFITKYNPCIRKIKQKLLKYWNIIINDESCNKLFNKHPIVAYSRHKKRYPE